MASIICLSGGASASLSGVAFTKTMNLGICVSFRAIHIGVEQRDAESTRLRRILREIPIGLANRPTDTNANPHGAGPCSVVDEQRRRDQLPVRGRLPAADVPA